MDIIGERRALQPPFAAFFVRLIPRNVAFTRRRWLLVRACWAVAAAANLAQGVLAWHRHSGTVWLSLLAAVAFLIAISLPFRTIVRGGVMP